MCIRDRALRKQMEEHQRLIDSIPVSKPLQMPEVQPAPEVSPTIEVVQVQEPVVEEPIVVEPIVEKVIPEEKIVQETTVSYTHLNSIGRSLSFLPLRSFSSLMSFLRGLINGLT